MPSADSSVKPAGLTWRDANGRRTAQASPNHAGTIAEAGAYFAARLGSERFTRYRCMIGLATCSSRLQGLVRTSSYTLRARAKYVVEAPPTAATAALSYEDPSVIAVAPGASPRPGGLVACGMAMLASHGIRRALGDRNDLITAAFGALLVRLHNTAASAFGAVSIKGPETKTFRARHRDITGIVATIAVCHVDGVRPV